MGTAPDRRPVEAEELDSGGAGTERGEVLRFLGRPGVTRGAGVVETCRRDGDDAVTIANDDVAGRDLNVADARSSTDAAGSSLLRPRERDTDAEHGECQPL